MKFLTPSLFALTTATALVSAGPFFDVGPDYEAPSLEDTPAAFDHGTDISGSILLQRDWWTVFDDAELTSLIEEALAHNEDLTAATHRVDQARALAGQARADLFPQLAVEAQGGRQRSLQTNYAPSDYLRIPGLLSYELDLWSGVQRGADSARAEADAASFQYDAAWLSLSAQVAETVFLWRATQEEAQIVEATVATRREAERVIASRYELGSATELDLARAQAEAALTEADAAAVKGRLDRLSTALALLTGKPAPAFDESTIGSGLPEIPQPPLSAPALVLRARPDVAAAERRLASTADRIGVAKAAFYPSIRLTASAGWENNDFDQAIDSSNRIWSIMPQVYLPLFQGHRNKAKLAQAKARFEENYALFRQQVLIALKEVQDALTSREHLEVQADALARAHEASRRAANLSRTRYDAGYVSYLEVVDSERLALSAQRNLVQTHAQEILNTVQLIKALGGGWDHPEAALAQNRPDARRLK